MSKIGISQFCKRKQTLRSYNAQLFKHTNTNAGTSSTAQQLTEKYIDIFTYNTATTDHDPWHAGTTSSLAPFKLALFTKQTANLWNALKCKLKNFTRKKRKNCRGPKTDSSSTRHWSHSQYHQSECLRTAAPDRLHNLEKTHNFEKTLLLKSKLKNRLQTKKTARTEKITSTSRTKRWALIL